MTQHKPGDILLDKYRIEKLIGEGAFAEVYLATHIELNVSRALKILRKEAPGVGSTEFEDFQEHFKLEVQLGAVINHPTQPPPQPDPPLHTRCIIPFTPLKSTTYTLGDSMSFWITNVFCQSRKGNT